MSTYNTYDTTVDQQHFWNVVRLLEDMKAEKEKLVLEVSLLNDKIGLMVKALIQGNSIASQ